MKMPVPASAGQMNKEKEQAFTQLDVSVVFTTNSRTYLL